MFGSKIGPGSEPSENPSGLFAARRRLDLAMSVLSAEDRWLVVLCELEGWKITEVAKLQSKTECQIKMRLSRARSKMRKKLVALYGAKNSNNVWENEPYELSTGSEKIK